MEEIIETEEAIRAENADEPTVNESNSDAVAFDFDEMKRIVDEHFEGVKALVRYSKEKDANVLALSKQLQAYRDGFETSLLKRVALELIEYRESCRKSLRSIASSQLGIADSRKYIGYIKLDFEDMLENLGIRCNGDTVSYNGKNIDAELVRPAIKDVPALEEVELGCPETKDAKGLVEYLAACENAISEQLKNNAILDSVVKDCIAASAVYEQGLYQIVLYPVIRAIVKIYRELEKRTEAPEITEDNATAAYSEQLSAVIGETERVLELCDVRIDGYVSDVYDSKKHRILKMVDTDDPELNGRVICRYTDCYVMDDKVIYLSKVDVYKSKK